jgi:hypothetical protein
MIFDKLKKIANLIKDEKNKNKIISNIQKISDDLSSKDNLLIDIKEMSSIFDNEKVEEFSSNDKIKKITLDV